MAASDKDDQQQPQPGSADALRDAVERTFRDAAGGMAGAGARAQGLFDDAAAALARLSGSVDQQQPVVDAIEALTARVEELTRRVSVLEGTPAPAKRVAAKRAPARKPAAKKPAAKKPASKKRAAKKPAASS